MSTTSFAIDKLKADEKHNDDRIKKSSMEKNAVLGIHDDQEGKGIEPVDQLKLENGCADLYRASKQKGEDKSYEQKIINSSDLVLVEETEFILNNYFEEFEFIEKLFPQEFHATWKEIKDEKRKDNQKKLMAQKLQTEKAI